MPTASGRTMTSSGPGGSGSGPSSTTITPGDLVTAASICAGHSLRQAPLRVLVMGGTPGLRGESHPPAGRAITSPSKPDSGFLGPATNRQACPGEGHKHDKKLDKISPRVSQKVVYLLGAGHSSASRLARVGSRTAWSARPTG